MKNLHNKGKIFLAIFLSFIFCFSFAFVVNGFNFFNDFSAVYASENNIEQEGTTQETDDQKNNDNQDETPKLENWENVNDTTERLSNVNYAIDSASKLADFMNDFNSSTTTYTGIVYLTNNIDLSEKIWTPIGKNSSRSFQGVFDGRGYKITGLNINESTNFDAQGLFGYINGATIRNVFLESCSITTGAIYVGGLVGNATNSKIYNCGITGSIANTHGPSSSNYPITGGLLGQCSGTTVEYCYSYANVNGYKHDRLTPNRPNIYAYTGGLIGQSSSSNITACFYNGSSLSGYGNNTTGIANLSGSANVIKHTYTNYISTYTGSTGNTLSYNYLSSTSVSSSTASTDEFKKYWYYDENGYMFGIKNTYVLRGVGNIFFEITTNKLTQVGSSSSFNLETETKQYLFNPIGNVGDNISNITSDSNFSFYTMSIQRNSDEYNNVIFESGNGIFKNNNLQYSYEFTDADRTKQGSLAIEKLDTSTNVFNFNTSDKKISMLKSLTGDFRINLFERGIYKKTYFSVKKYKEVVGNEYEISSDVTFSVSILNDPTIQNGKYSSSWGDFELNSETNGFYAYVPYNEHYKIKFNNVTENYLEMLSGISMATTDNFSGSHSINLNSDSTYVNQYGVGEVNQYYLLNNRQNVKINSNYSSYPDLQIAGNGILFAEQTNAADVSSDIVVLVNESFKDKGIAFNGEKITEYISADSPLYPIWSRFKCTGFYLNSSPLNKGTQFIVNSKDYGSNLNFTDTKWTLKDSEDKILYAHYEQITDSHDIDVIWDEPDLQVDYTWSDIVVNGEIKANEETIKSSTQSISTNSLDGVVFDFQAKSGYVLNSIIIHDFREQYTFDVKNLNISDGLFFQYYGCAYTDGLSTNLQIHNSFTLSYDESTGIYQINFKFLMGISKIDFIFDTISYKVNFKTSDNLGTLKENAVCINDGTDHFINYQTPYSYNHKYKTTVKFAFKLEVGYAFNGFSTTGYKSNGELITVNLIAISTDSNGNYLITLNNVTSDLDHIDILINLQRNNYILNVKVNGIDDDTFTNVNTTYTLDKYYYDATGSFVSVSSNIQNKDLIGEEIFSDSKTVIQLSFNSYVVIQSITFNNIDEAQSVTLNGNLPNTSIKFELSNMYYENNTEISCEIQLKLVTSNIDFVKVNAGRTDIEISRQSLSQQFSIASTLTITKTNQTYTFTFFDNSNQNSEEFVVSQDSGIQDILFSIGNSTDQTLSSNYSTSLTNYILNNLTGLDVTVKYVYKQTQIYLFDALMGASGNNATISTIKNPSSYSISGVKDNHGFKDDSVTLSNGSNVGYTFVGYAVISSATDLGYVNGSVINGSNYYTNNVFVLGKQPIENLLNFTYIIALFKANVYTINFKTDVIDEVTNSALTTKLVYENGNEFNSTIKVEYNTMISSLPILTIDGMYNFGGWSYDGGKKQIVYSNNFNFDSPFTLSSEINTFIVDFYPIANAKQVNYQLMDTLTNTVIGNGTVTYNDKNYSTVKVPSTKNGYVFTGWGYEGTAYLNYVNSNWVYEVFNLDKTDIVFTSIYLANEITLTFNAGQGSFEGGAKTLTGKVIYGTNDYYDDENLLFNEDGEFNAQTWSDGDVVYTFKYFILRGSRESDGKIVYSKNNENNFVFEGNTLEFVAFYEISSASVSLKIDNDDYDWVYDGVEHKVNVVTPSLNLSYSYAWYKISNSKEQKISGQTSQSLSLKNVSDSGQYLCEVTITATNGASGSITVRTSAIEVKIDRKLLQFTQDGNVTKNLVKVFDNNAFTDSKTVGFTGVVMNEGISMTAQYTNINVGQNIAMVITITSSQGANTGNYTYEDDVVGEITPYTIVYTVKGSIYQVGEESKQISITSNYYSVDESTTRFLQMNNFSASINLRTSANRIGVYVYGGNSYSILATDFNVKNGGNNFVYNVTGQFEIKSTTDAISINIMARSKDLGDNMIDKSIATLTVSANDLEIDGNGGNDVSLVGAKTFFNQHKSINISVNILNTNYWVESWEIYVDGSLQQNNFGQNKEIIYDINNTNISNIVIYVYVTTLKVVYFDYNLAPGETLDVMVTQTKFAMQQTIAYSIATYNAQLPQPVRTGWIFDGWKIGNDIITVNSSWTYQADTLKAMWTLEDIKLDQNSLTYNNVYDGLNHDFSFEIVNINNACLTYTYQWTSTAKQKGKCTNSLLTVKNVDESGVYTLTITASYNSISKKMTATVNVNITKLDIFKQNVVVNKQYDKSNITPNIEQDGANGEKITVVGKYLGVNAGSLISKDLKDYTISVKLGNTIMPSSNYNLNIELIDENSTIERKDVVLDIGTQSKVYDGKVLKYNNTYSDEKTPFGYTISTNSASIGTYIGESLNIEITGDIISNFNITINGSLIIQKLGLPAEIQWEGETELTFDGNYHSISPKLPEGFAITKIIYEGNTRVEYDINENTGVLNADTYNVIVVLEASENYEDVGQISTTMTIRPRNIYLSLTNSYSKVYDNSTDIDNLDLAIWDRLNVTPLAITSTLLPTFVYHFDNINVGTNKNIIVSLDSENANNSNYNLQTTNLKGDITKRDIVLTISAQKQYDGLPFVVNNNDNNIIADNLAIGDTISGNIVILDILNAGVYKNADNLSKEINLIIGSSKYNLNYNVKFSTSENNIVIEKAKILVGVTSNQNYEYSGKQVEINYGISRQDVNENAEKPSTLTLTYFDSSNNALSYTPVTVGSYSFKYALNQEDKDNFVLFDGNKEIEESNFVKFNITQRVIKIKFQKYFDYSGEIIVYSSENYPMDNVLDNTTSIGEGDVFSWSYTTSSEDSNVYKIIDLDKSLIQHKITKNGVNYTDNYLIQISNEAEIIISKQSVDLSDLKVLAGAEYNGNPQKIQVIATVEAREVVITFGEDSTDGRIYAVKRINSIIGTTDIFDASDVKYAGEYKFMIELENFTIKNNRELSFVITPRRITATVLNADKTYDGTNAVAQENIKVDGVVLNDPIVIQGVYNDKNVGTKNITLSLTCQNQLILSSYELVIEGTIKGTISPRNLSFKAEYSTYFVNANIVIGIEYFDVDGLQNMETLSGEITIKRSQAGRYDLSQLSVKDDVIFNLNAYTFTGEESPISNYNLNSLSGYLDILKAEVLVSVTNLTTIYNAQVQTPKFEYRIYNNHGAIIKNEDLKIGVVYKQNNLEVQAPIDAGDYEITISTSSNNYILIDNEGRIIDRFTLIDRFTILKRQIAINVAQTIYHNYDGQIATYVIKNSDIVDPSENKNNGLLENHEVNITLKTNNNIGGKYVIFNLDGLLISQQDTNGKYINPIYAESLQVTIGGLLTDVTNNYEFVYFTATIVIVAQVQNIDSSNIENLEYSAQNKLNSDFVISFEISGSKYEIAYGQSVDFGNIQDTTYEYTATLGEFKVFDNNAFVDISQAIDVGLYQFKLIIVNNFDNSYSLDSSEVQFNIIPKTITSVYCNEGAFDKFYDRTSRVIQNIYSNDIFDVDQEYVTIIGAYVEDSDLISTVGTHNIRFTLSGEKSKNYTINVTQSGNIEKQNIILQLINDYSTYYLASNLSVLISNFKAIAIKDDLREEINGFLAGFVGNIKLKIENVGEYLLSNLYSDGLIEQAFTDTQNMLQNYSITGYEGKITINPAELEINITKDSVIYNAQQQQIDYQVDIYENHGVKQDNLSVTLKYANIDNLPVNAGTYDVTFTVNSNYVFIVDGVNVGDTYTYKTFTIQKRNIVIDIGHVEKPYTTEVIVYSIKESDIKADNLVAESGLIAGHIPQGTFTTKSSELNTYVYSVNGDDLIFELIGIFSGNVEVTQNYNISSISGEIQIVPAVMGEPDFEHVQNLVYNGKDYVKTGDIYVYVVINSTNIKFVLNEENSFGSLTNLKYNGTSVTEVRLAGEYSVELTINSREEITNKEYKFTVQRKAIQDITFEQNKKYDGNNSVIGTILSNDICEDENGVLDEVIILGYYDNANVGVHNITFTTLSGKHADNYSINLTKQGEITSKEALLQLKQDYSTYYTNHSIKLDTSYFDFLVDDVDNGLISYLSGEVEINIINVGKYNLIDNFEQIILSNLTSTDENFLKNYTIIGVQGNLQINKAQIQVTVQENEKTYNGYAQLAEITFEIYNNHGELEDDNIELLNVSYKLENGVVSIKRPVNAGKYVINIEISSKYAQSYEIYEINDTSFTINKLQIKIVVENQVSFDFNGKAAVYNIQNIDVKSLDGNNGLVGNDTIVGTLTTNGTKGGVYAISNVSYPSDFTNSQLIPNISLLNAGENVDNNYEIISIDATILIISQLGDITHNLDSLVYDKTDKIQSKLIKISIVIDNELTTFVYGDESTICTFSDLMYNGESTDVVINSGEYSFNVKINCNGAEKQEKIVFNVAKILISSLNINQNKTYDATENVVGEISPKENCIISGDDVQFTAKYYDGENTTSNVGVHEIKIEIFGTDSFNYQIGEFKLSGEIFAKNININVKNDTNLIFSGQRLDVQSQDLVTSDLIEGHLLQGFITLNLIDAGEFDIEVYDYSALFIVSGENDVTQNYNINFVGRVVINPLEIMLEIQPIELIYNGGVQDIKQFITLQGHEEDYNEIISYINISYDNVPENAGHYSATINSNSTNYVFNINNVEFDISQRDISIDLGTIQVTYNPTSDYLTKIDAAYVQNMVSDQILSGTFRLFKAGLDVGAYSYENEEIIFENLKVVVNGQDILSLNYNLTSISGTVEIISATIVSGDIYLLNDTFVYAKLDYTSQLQIKFIDANNEIQTITSSNTSLGSFVVDQGEAINVGNYTITVTIYNYVLENNKLTFVITPRTISASSIIFNNNKTYDSDSFVYNQNGLKNLYPGNILSGDNVVIQGHYIDANGEATSNIGVHDIVFEIISGGENYVLANSNTKGEIFAINLTLEITKQNFVYKVLGEYVLNYGSDIIISSGQLLESDTLSGFILITKVNYIGVINDNLSTQNLIIKNNDVDVTQNYIIKVEGQVEIIKASVRLSFDGIANSYVYSANAVAIVPEIIFDDENIPQVDVSYMSGGINANPVNVGNYVAVFSVDTQFYQLEGDSSFEFEITTYDLVIKSGQISDNLFYKNFGAEDPKEMTIGLDGLNSEVVNVYFTREPGENVGTYDLFIEYWDNTNYKVTFEDGANSDLFKIRKSGILHVEILDNENNKQILSKVYDAQNIQNINIELLNYDAGDEILSGYLTFASGCNVGQYELESWNLTSLNYDNFDVVCPQFNIIERTVTITANNTNKIYENSTEFYGEFVLYDGEDLLDLETYPLVVTGEYQTANVGEHIKVDLTIGGDNLSNYIFVGEVFGNIAKRNVNIVPNSNQSAIYGDNFEISYEIVDLYPIATIDYQSLINGDLYISYKQDKTKFVVGNYEIYSNLESENLELNFVSGISFEIVKRELQIVAVNGLVKVYDGDSTVKSELQIVGLLDNDKVFVSGTYYDKNLIGPNPSVDNEKIVVYTLSGDDAENYYAPNAVGGITDKIVILHYDYKQVDLIFGERMTNNAIEYSNLTFGVAISDSIGSLPNPSHEGYTFEGWYLDNGTQFTAQTIINNENWGVDNDELTVYARWTIAKFQLNIISVTRVQGVYSQDNSVQGGTLTDISGLYDYMQVVELNNLATAYSGYEFLGFSTDISLNVDDELLTNGVTITANEITLYAKFAPLSVTIILNANNGTFNRCENWIFDASNSTATLVVEYNTELGVELPTLQRVGYTFSGNWRTEIHQIEFNSNTIIGEEFYPETTLYAIWIANKASLILDANGGYFETFNTWNEFEKNSLDQVIKIEKEIDYDDRVGFIAIPVRLGYDFAGWDLENFDEDYIWQSTTQITVKALWEEKQYTLSVQADHGDFVVYVYSSERELVSEYDTRSVDINEISVMTTNIVVVQVISHLGYTFTNWTSSIQELNESVDVQIEINSFTDDQYLIANFVANDNTITLKVDNSIRGYVKYEDYSTSTIGEIQIIAKSNTQISLTATANEGYSVAYWVVEGGDYKLSGNDSDLTRILSDFVTNLTVTVYFNCDNNQITVISDEIKGVISVGEVENMSRITISANTESEVVFTVTAKHGYIISTNIEDWIFDTSSINKGNFELEGDEFILTITFKGFTANGEIHVPFNKQDFTINFVAVLKTNNFVEDLTLEDIVTIQGNEFNQTLNSSESFSGQYEAIYKFIPRNILEGYTFSMWSLENSREHILTLQDGCIQIYDDNSMDFEIKDDITIYLIYTVTFFEVKFSVNDEVKGSMNYDDLTGLKLFSQQVAYNQNTLPVVAVSDENYLFEKWVKVVDGKYVDVSTENLIIVQNVLENCEFVAIFGGKPIEIVLNFILPEEEIFVDEEIDFGELNIVTNDNLIIESNSRLGNTLIYNISTYTGQTLVFDIITRNGYEFASIILDPRLYYQTPSKDLYTITNLIQCSINIYAKAKINEVIFKLTGKTVGADIYEYSNDAKGVVRLESFDDGKTLKAYVKTGGDVYSIIMAYYGYTIVSNDYFKNTLQQTYSTSSYAIGGITNVNQDTQIEIEVRPYVYNVTFDFNYDDAQLTASGKIEFGASEFSTPLEDYVKYPEREKYVFIGWSTNADGTGDLYYFDIGGIYTYVSNTNGTTNKVYGFKGSQDNYQSVDPSYDYDCTLYGVWDLERFKVDIVFVPGFAVSGNLVYQQIFPNEAGRYIRFYNDGSLQIQGVSYTPGSEVMVIAPVGLSGYTYYGWSLQRDITNRELINTGYYNDIMGEENIIIYLYYLMNISLVQSVGGTISSSTHDALYNEEFTVSAVADAGYDFDCWYKNGTKIEDSEISQKIVATSPLSIRAEFIGKIVEVRLANIDKAKIRIVSPTGNDIVYRVGDTITFEVYDVAFGYYHSTYNGEFSGNIRNNQQYTITADDFNRGYVLFRPVVVAQKVSVQFHIQNGEGGEFIFDGSHTVYRTFTVDYDSVLEFKLITLLRYHLDELTFNNVAIDLNTTSLLVNVENNFTLNPSTNVIKAVFSKLLWVDVYEMFGGTGTANDPYMITNANQLAAMAYLINNNIEAVGTIPYDEGYYVLMTNINLSERFWQPIAMYEDHPFKGRFMFKGHNVYELLLDKDYEVTNYGGLFGYISPEAIINTEPGDYTFAIVFIVSGISFIIFIVIIILILIFKRKKKAKELENASTIDINNINKDDNDEDDETEKNE